VNWGVLLAALPFGFAIGWLLAGHRLRRYREPVPPENMRAVLPDGTVIPIELTYEGRRKGCAVWRATTAVAVPHGAQLLCDKFPGRTTIELGFVLDR
jgi:hypothetical protein